MRRLAVDRRGRDAQLTIKRPLVVIAVLPVYRREFVEIVRERLNGEVDFAAGQAHLVESVKSAAVSELPHIRLRNRCFLGRRLLWQDGALRLSARREVVVTDLNPRSITAWIILISRRIHGRRTLVWGHILPRAGVRAKTVPLRRFMRRLADGVISYTWADREIVHLEDPEVPVWVAANGLYRVEALGAAPDSQRRDFIYVGRLVQEKKPMLMIEAMAFLVRQVPTTEARLIVVGDGPELAELQAFARRLGIGDRVEFTGSLTAVETLKPLYARCIASLSPGYAGLSLTQSLGFGVPMIVADTEPHAPEIELLTEQTGIFFRADDSESLGRAMENMIRDQALWNSRRPTLVDLVSARYSAESMASGFLSALGGKADGR